MFFYLVLLDIHENIWFIRLMLGRYNRRSRSSSFQTGAIIKKLKSFRSVPGTARLNNLLKLIFFAVVRVSTDHLSYLLTICGDTNRGLSYLTNAMATPPSTFKTFPVDLCSKPPTKAKQALAISSGNII